MSATPDRIALVGLRCSGKTTLAAALGSALGWPWSDSDDVLAARVGVAAGRFLADAGEARFRVVEEEVCLELAAAPGPWVLALGGGALGSERVRARIADLPAVVWLTAPAAVLAQRQRRDRSRPPLTGLGLDDEVAMLAERRRPDYAAVVGDRGLVLDSSELSVEACVAKVEECFGCRRPASDERLGGWRDRGPADV